MEANQKEMTRERNVLWAVEGNVFGLGFYSSVCVCVEGRTPKTKAPTNRLHRETKLLRI